MISIGGDRLLLVPMTARTASGARTWLHADSMAVAGCGADSITVRRFDTGRTIFAVVVPVALVTLWIAVAVSSMHFDLPTEGQSW
jgi:hypothetical protein